MNRGRLSWLNIIHWPIWVKIVVVVGVGLLALGLPAYLAVRTATFESGLENARRLLQFNGSQQIATLNNLIDETQDALDTFLADEQRRQDSLSLLLGTDARISADDMSEQLAAVLLDPAATIYEDMRLLDRQGLVLAAASTGVAAENLIGVNQSRTAAFQAGIAAFVAGETRTLVTSRVGDVPVLEVVQAVSRRSGELAGYLIGRIDSDRLLDALAVPNADYSAFTRIAADDGIVFAQQLADGSASAEPPAVTARALDGQTGIERYRTSDGTEVLGFYAPGVGGSLAVISELPLSQIDERAFSYFSARAFVLGAGFLALGAVMVAALLVLNQLLVPPLVRLRRATQALAQGNFTYEVPDSTREDEIGALASSFVAMREQVQLLVSELDLRLAARTTDIDTTKQVSQLATAQRDLQSLLDQVVGLIIERIPTIYHAQVFLIDEQSQQAVLRASTGAIGQMLLARGHRLGIGTVSIVGQAAAQKRTIIARDTSASALHRQQQLLPETRAEMAVPLSFDDRVIGVLDVQSKLADAFPADQIIVLETIANQIAVAIKSAYLHTESAEWRARIEEANRQATTRVWQDYMRDQRVRDLSSSAGVEPNRTLSGLRRTAISRRQPVVGPMTERQTIPVALPIQIAGQVLGAVEWELPAAEFDQSKLELAQELANRLAVGLENARLFQESQRAAERERLVNSIAARLTAQTDINDILQTAVREVGQALRAPQVTIRLHNQNQPVNGNGAAGGHSKTPAN